jgi:integrase
MNQKNERNLKFKDGKWCVDINFKKAGGKFRRVRTAFPTKMQAQTHLDLLRSQKAMRKLGFDLPESKKEDLLFKDFAEGFITQHSLGRPKTRAAHRSCLNCLLKSDLFKEKRLSEITAETVARYHSTRGANEKVSANRELGFLKLIFRRAVEWGEISRNPAALVKKFPEPKNKLRILSDDEADRLLEKANPQLAPVLTILLTTAMRPHEVFALRWEYPGWDTENDLEVSIVSIKKKMIFIPGGLAKNHKDREVPLSKELIALFEALPGDSKSGKVFPMNTAPKSFKAAVKGAELKNVTLYTLKHTAASRMIKAGVDIITVTELIGHSDVKTTMIYCHSSSETKREAVEKLSRIYFPTSKQVVAPAATPKESRRSIPGELYN